MKKLLTRIAALLPVLGLLTLLGAPTNAQEFAGRGHGHRSNVVRSHRAPSYSSSRIWIPGRYEMQTQRVFIAATSRRIWIAPHYATRVLPCGTLERYVAIPGHFETICEPAHYETRNCRVWIKGRYEVRGRRGIRRSTRGRRVRLR